MSSVTRSWNDPTGNSASVPNCDLANPAANGDGGAISNNQFGLPNPNATRYSPTVLNGYGARDYYWDGSVTASQQITPTLSVTGGYYYEHDRHPESGHRAVGLQPVLCHGDYSITNDAAIVSLNTRFNPAAGSTTWLRPTKVLDPRLIEISGRIDF